MTSPARLFAVGMVTLAVTGAAGTALLHGRPPQDKPPTKAPADPKPPAATLTVNAPADAGPPRLAEEGLVRLWLTRPAGVKELNALTLGTLLDELERQGLDTRIDLPALLRAGCPEELLGKLRDEKLKGFAGRGNTWADVLADATAGVRWGGGPEAGTGPNRLTYWVSGTRVVVGPAYRTPSVPGAGSRPDHQPLLPPEEMMEQIVGPPVSVTLDGLTVDAAVKALRGLTGANIVVDARARDTTAGRVAGTFDDVRLLTVLQVLADQVGLKPVTLNNVYYLTDPANAAALQKLVDRDLHGSPPPAGGAAGLPIPAGFVTDGYQYFPRTADMKPVDAAKLGLGGVGLGGGGVPLVPGTLPVPAPAEKK